MSNWLGFYILPFDWRTSPQAKITLPIDVNDFVDQLQIECPTGEVATFESAVRLYVKTEKNDPWVVLSFSSGDTIADISAWPKPLAVKLILWYRRYVSLKYPLFLVVANDGGVLELTEHTSSKEVEDHFPPNWVYK